MKQSHTQRKQTSDPLLSCPLVAAIVFTSPPLLLLPPQGQIQIARARLTGKGVGGDSATSAFAMALSRVAAGASNNRVWSRLRLSSEKVLATLPKTTTANAPTINGVTNAGTSAAAVHVLPADAASREVRAAAERMAKLVAAVEVTANTGSEVDHTAVALEVTAEAEALAARAEALDQDLRNLNRKVEEAVGQVESWQQRRREAPEYAAEEAALEDSWSEANREVNTAALREMRALLPEAVWEMNAGGIQAAAAAAVAEKGALGTTGDRASGDIFYPSDLCVRLRLCRPLHWLVSSPEDIAVANFLVGQGATAFTQLEGMDLTEMRALWCVLPKEFARDANGKKAEWRARFRLQLEGMARQQERAIITAG